MMVLAPAIAFLAVDGFARDFGPWEKTMLAALWLMPLIARSVAQMSLIPARRAGHAGCFCFDIAAQRIWFAAVSVRGGILRRTPYIRCEVR